MACSQEHVNGVQEKGQSGLLLWVKPVEVRPEAGAEDTESVDISSPSGALGAPGV